MTTVIAIELQFVGNRAIPRHGAEINSLMEGELAPLLLRYQYAIVSEEQKDPRDPFQWIVRVEGPFAYREAVEQSLGYLFDQWYTDGIIRSYSLEEESAPDPRHRLQGRVYRAPGVFEQEQQQWGVYRP